MKTHARQRSILAVFRVSDDEAANWTKLTFVVLTQQNPKRGWDEREAISRQNGEPSRFKRPSGCRWPESE